MTESVNVVNTEDALKYLPSLVVRKRRIGDQQAPLATRTSGLGQSARSLIYADGYLLSSLIGNNNSSASPRWALVTPEEIERIDVMYGPFSAAYPGNSMGAVVEISTRMPQQLEAGAKFRVRARSEPARIVQPLRCMLRCRRFIWRDTPWQQQQIGP
jgi:iron complex outermembrane receptor protein